MPFKGVAFKNLVCERVASFIHQQTQDNLRLVMLTILAVTDHAQVVFFLGFKVNGGYVVKDDRNLAARNSHSMPVTDVLDLANLIFMRFVKISV